ncbi:TPR repeat-containing thioredoxin TTL1 isoform X2 [Argentina anserina]|uniref:TPR repeat-containing thioredoxin TTL1 isoform X2 n=1 Tax=Argentina anserina TaxID=57926 RepID=UPI002176581E|nr:TPR repeat-containing thioredoxin TTL1 isoform X2 [Potentilla anserina]
MAEMANYKAQENDVSKNPKESKEVSFVISTISSKPSPNQEVKHTRKPSLEHPRSPVTGTHQKVFQGRRSSDDGRSSTSSDGSRQLKVFVAPEENKIRRASTTSSVELSRKINDHHQANESKPLVRASSGSVIHSGQFGNLRLQPGISSLLTSSSTPNSTPKCKAAVMGNIVKKNSDDHGVISSVNTLDPEALKSMGNDAYKENRFEEALALYDRAIALDSTKAAYHSNKSAALICLGRLIEAVFECKEAIHIEPSYYKAHYRLATAYLRLGETEKALDHYKLSCPYAYSKDIDECQALQKCLSRCIEAQKLQEWNVLLNETQLAISSGANSAPQVFALQAEALLKLHRHEDAYSTYQNRPNFSIILCTKFFGMENSAYLLMINAQVYLAAGRFEDAMAAAQQAARLNPGHKEIGTVVKRARTVASARSSGNLLFKASKFAEASVVYSQGLEQDPYNSVLLCNRAACRSKLGQYEKAVEDCTAALNLQPCYSKARLRRADCNAKLERWGASIKDYELLIRKTPGDEEVGKALYEAQMQLKRLHGEDTGNMKFGLNLISIPNNERFRHYVTSPGMSVVLFCSKSTQKQVFQSLEQICKRFPSVNFLKVEVEDHPYLAKLEDVSTIPAFKIYKNGSRVKEIPGNHHELLESSVKLYSGSGL